MALYRANISYKIGANPSTQKNYLVTASNIQQAFVKIFNANADINIASEISITTVSETAEVLQ